MAAEPKPPTPGAGTRPAAGTSSGPDGPSSPGPLYFFPDRPVDAAELQRILRAGSRKERAWAISHLVRYAQWDDIWRHVTRDEVREILPELELPETLRQRLARMLKAEAPVP